ncbi:polymorphic toxin type 44 domain-containing protein [Saprospira sp. CCB-QB6]|uniref:polymorphic toxin type 44 domain-containing protein n=1 Tax=Saprospira sp. CCB-QB6 TaxID=3023936 RepID=UPI0023493A70|nr:polymorphic toxin type 44 domain-containing protein [Saprospira sp. CCB-QB6]WCL81174.1 polymorphic toxin type 44 domain-containing protein [Saprospira sp. CCB-QB6]
MQYEYDPMGNRLAKKKLYVDGPVDIRSEGQYYVRDPQGNVLAVYQYNEENIALVDDKDSLYLEELHLYGSARLGILKKALALRYRDESGAVGLPAGSLLKTALAQSSYQQLELGRRRYELSNHLGNVLATVSDKSLGQDSSQTGQADYYLAQVSSASLCYPFGWEMPGRKFVSGEDYRFGFNGVEQEDEIAEGVNFTYFRMQDSRLGRWWSHDPKPNVSVSPYAMMENNPVMFSDVLGDTTVVDKVGNIIRMDVKVEGKIIKRPLDNYPVDLSRTQRTDDLVFMKNKDGSLTKLGEFGGKIDISTIYANLIDQNYKEVMSWKKAGTAIAFSFFQKVRGGGDWDYKIQDETIYGYVNFSEKNPDDSKNTKFIFGTQMMEPQDIGNHHFGVMGLATNIFSEYILLSQAGAAQMRSGTSKPEWQKYKWHTYESEFGGTMRYRGRMLPPYGDDPRDQSWIRKGFNYYHQYKPLLDNSYKSFFKQQQKEKGNGGSAGMGGHAGRQPNYYRSKK